MSLLDLILPNGTKEKHDDYCVNMSVSFKERWAVMECSNCGRRRVWFRKYYSDGEKERLKQKYARGPIDESARCVE